MDEITGIITVIIDFKLDGENCIIDSNTKTSLNGSGIPRELSQDIHLTLYETTRTIAAKYQSETDNDSLLRDVIEKLTKLRDGE